MMDAFLADDISIDFPDERAIFLCFSVSISPFVQELSQLGDMWVPS
jgi:hypothetical protein